MNSTTRFSSRVENYVKYRPSYPRDVIELLRRECGLMSGSVVADLGSGTGILSKLLLDAGWHVFGVEPNREMRETGERMLNVPIPLPATPSASRDRGKHTNFVSVDGTAEATTLPDASADLVTAGQAFHWFNVAATRRECLRILKPSGWTALIWNSRKLDDQDGSSRRLDLSEPNSPDAPSRGWTGSTFARDYEQLLRDFSDDYANVNHQDNVSDAAIDAFFGAGGWRKSTFDNAQHFDFDGLRGRLLSSSYAPDVGHPNHEPMLRRLREIFDAHQRDGRVTFAYDTEVFYGQPSSTAFTALR